MHCLLIIKLVILFSSALLIENEGKQYEPTWESLDSRPLPQWYDDAKFGIFLHWGVYSVPSFGSEWFWWYWRTKVEKYVDFMNKNYPPNFSYQEFAADFRAEFFNASKWANLFQASGAKYIVLTSKHHEGYTLWPSNYSYSWNAVDVGPRRDLIAELSSAIRNKTDLRFGLYHSLFEWVNPLYLEDQKNGFKTNKFSVEKIIPEMKELIMNYKPEVFWSDGDADGTDEYWQSKEFIAWIFNESPVKDSIVVNDRWGVNISCHHGDFYTCSDRFNPGVLQPHKWENAMTIDKQSWGYRRNADISDYLTTKELIKELVTTISCGGNLLMNIGPTKEGTIAPIFQERLLEIGLWLSYNGEAIYGTKPWKYQNDSLSDDVWYTSKSTSTYAILLQWPNGNILTLGSANTLFVNKQTSVTMLGWQVSEELKWGLENDKVKITMPNKAKVSIKWGWILKIKS